jgi:hypothetical protein
VKKKYKNKTVTKFRSKLEKTCWDLLTEAELGFFYEPFKVPLLEGFEYNNDSWEKVGKEYKLQKKKVQRMTYTPDFVSSHNLTKNLWIIETKGYPTDSFKLKWKRLKQYASENNYSWTLYMPTNKGEIEFTIENLLKNEKTK